MQPGSTVCHPTVLSCCDVTRSTVFNGNNCPRVVVGAARQRQSSHCILRLCRRAASSCCRWWLVRVCYQRSASRNHIPVNHQFLCKYLCDCWFTTVTIRFLHSFTACCKMYLFRNCSHCRQWYLQTAFTDYRIEDCFRIFHTHF